MSLILDQKFSNKQKLLFKIIKVINKYFYDIQFEIDGLILENQFHNIIKQGDCLHPDINKYPKGKNFIFYHICFEEALKYQHRVDFQYFSSSIYKTAQTNGWLNEMCNHMIKLKTNWTIDMIKPIALQSTHRNEFKLKNSDAYHYALRQGWLDEVCKHMNYFDQNDYDRLVYAWKFPDYHIYIGITKNEKIREAHRKYNLNDPVNKYKLESGLDPTYEKLTDFIKSEDAVELEKFYIKDFSDKGYIVLNKNSGGSIGRSHKQKL